MANTRCSFCTKSNLDVEIISGGYNTYICYECVDLCTEIVRLEREIDKGIGALRETRGLHALAIQKKDKRWQTE